MMMKTKMQWSTKMCPANILAWKITTIPQKRIISARKASLLAIRMNKTTKAMMKTMMTMEEMSATMTGRTKIDKYRGVNSE